MNDEITLWKGSPSQWLNLWNFAGGILAIIALVVGGLFFPPLFAVLILPLGFMLWKFLEVKLTRFELTSERLRITRGVINQHIDEIELYRIKDSQMTRAWWMRLTGLSSIDLQTSDRSMPTLTIPAIFNGTEMREELRKQVEIMRDRKRVREMDFDEAGDQGMADL